MPQDLRATAKRQHHLRNRRNPFRNPFVPEKNVRNMPGHLPTDLELRREYLESDWWIGKDYRTCKGSNLLHNVHVDDCFPICKLCASRSISNVDPDSVQKDVDPEAVRILENLNFTCFQKGMDTPCITKKNVSSISTVKGNPVLLPVESVLLVNRFNDTSGIKESLLSFWNMVSVKKRADEETPREEYAEIPIYSGTLVEICENIRLYYHVLGEEIQAESIKINGIFHLKGKKFGCTVIRE
jgi:hypothetical protein